MLTCLLIVAMLSTIIMLAVNLGKHRPEEPAIHNKITVRYFDKDGVKDNLECLGVNEPFISN